jgi:hypothetical protein
MFDGCLNIFDTLTHGTVHSGIVLYLSFVIYDVSVILGRLPLLNRENFYFTTSGDICSLILNFQNIRR